MKDKLKIIDTVEVVVRDRYGCIRSQRIINQGYIHRLMCKLGLRHNSITNLGMAEMAGLVLTDVGGTAFDYIAIGTGTNAAGATNTTLQTELGRAASTGTRVQTTVANDTAQWTHVFSNANNGFTGTSVITEIGILNAGSNGTLLLRQVYSPGDSMNWDQGDTITVTVKCQMKQGT